MFEIPSLEVIKKRLEADLLLELNAKEKHEQLLPKILATAWAGAFYSLYGYLEWQYRQLWPHSADAKSLNQFFELSRSPATYAEGIVEFQGRGQVASGSLFIIGNEEKRYRLEETVTMPGNGILIAENPGEAYNLPEKKFNPEPLETIPGFEKAILLFGCKGGADEESDSSPRKRIVQRRRYPPHGGNLADYYNWLGNVSGIDYGQAWVVQYLEGRGTVGIVLAPEVPPGVEKFVYLQLRKKKPVTAKLVVVPAEVLHLDIKIIANISSAAKTSIDSQLRDYIVRNAKPKGCHTPDGVEQTGRVAVRGIYDILNRSIAGNYQLQSPTQDIKPTKITQIIRARTIDIGTR